MKQTDDLRIKAIKELSPPAQIHTELPITENAADTVYKTRERIHKILHDEDDRLLVIIGPCSVHDPEAALEYAQRLQPVR
ncbi:MAG: 3-deoxy-7-phosphoheptulonate synthase, partial [Candidatus Thiodiazotropha sp.]